MDMSAEDMREDLHRAGGGVAEAFDPAKDGSVTARAELLEMRYDGPAEA